MFRSILAIALALGLGSPAATQGLFSGDQITSSVIARGDIVDSTVVLGNVTGLGPGEVLAMTREFCGNDALDRIARSGGPL